LSDVDNIYIRTDGNVHLCDDGDSDTNISDYGCISAAVGSSSNGIFQLETISYNENPEEYDLSEYSLRLYFHPEKAIDNIESNDNIPYSIEIKAVDENDSSSALSVIPITVNHISYDYPIEDCLHPNASEF